MSSAVPSVVNGWISPSDVRLVNMLSIPLRFLNRRSRRSEKTTNITVAATPITTPLATAIFRLLLLVGIEIADGESLIGTLVIEELCEIPANDI